MKTYEITIKPLSGFATHLKGDTIFGHFCWQLAYDEQELLGEQFGTLIARYLEAPFVVFSSAFPKLYVNRTYTYALPTPSLPPDCMFDLPQDTVQRIKKRKEVKSKKWMLVPEGKKFSSFKDFKFCNDKELFDEFKAALSDKERQQIHKRGGGSFITDFLQSHNTINRDTGTTGDAQFAPFSVEHGVYYPNTELALFVGIDDDVVTIEQVITAIGRIGDMGFGRDASTGLGRFCLGEWMEIDLMGLGSDNPNACYTLAPCVPERDIYADMFFTPFTRFGRHGDVLARSGNPFKCPIVMADEGAVFMPKNKDIPKKPYIGVGVTGISLVHKKTVAQGYSLYIPISVEV